MKLDEENYKHNKLVCNKERQNIRMNKICGAKKIGIKKLSFKIVQERKGGTNLELGICTLKFWEPTILKKKFSKISKAGNGCVKIP